MRHYSLVIEDEAGLAEVARKLADVFRNKSILVFLEGDLGAGKTTFMRHYLEAMGHHGTVVSPTYTLIEIYDLENINIVHSDCYRISEDDIYFLDFPAYLAESKNHQIWIEWAEQFSHVLPAHDLKVQLIHLGQEKRELVLQVPACLGLELDVIKN